MRERPATETVLTLVRTAMLVPLMFKQELLSIVTLTALILGSHRVKMTMVAARAAAIPQVTMIARKVAATVSLSWVRLVMAIARPHVKTTMLAQPISWWAQRNHAVLLAVIMGLIAVSMAMAVAHQGVIQMMITIALALVVTAFLIAVKLVTAIVRRAAMMRMHVRWIALREVN
jgi:hypothetical protein